MYLDTLLVWYKINMHWVLVLLTCYYVFWWIKLMPNYIHSINCFAYDDIYDFNVQRGHNMTGKCNMHLFCMRQLNVESLRLRSYERIMRVLAKAISKSTCYVIQMLFLKADTDIESINFKFIGAFKLNYVKWVRVFYKHFHTRVDSFYGWFAKQNILVGWHERVFVHILFPAKLL